MKNIFLKIAVVALAAATLTPAPALAQALPAIPNSSFDTWTSRTIQGLGGPITFQAPQNWELGFLSSLLVGFTGQQPNFARSTIAHSGPASAMITISPDSIGGDLATQIGYPVQYLAGASVWARASFALPPAAPSDDEGIVLLVATRSRPGGGGSDTLGYGGLSVRPTVANTWFPVVGGFFYLDPALVQSDSLFINLAFYQSLPGRQMWFDDLQLLRTLPVGTAPAVAKAAPLTLSPNPAGNGQTAYFDVDAPTAGPAGLLITDLLGRDISRTRVVPLAVGANHLALPTAGLPAGTYLVRLVQGSIGMRSAKLVIE